MERLTSIQTIEYADGTCHEQIYCFGHLWGPAFFKKGTKDYEEYMAIVKRLAEYEDLEEEGELLKLPCAVGNIVYQLMIVGVNEDSKRPKYEIFKSKVFRFSIDSFTLCFMTETMKKKKYHNEFPLSAFGKTVFLTREEAEAALKELQKGQENERDSF